ncbi:MAG: bifunctional ADP-heptose synthase [Deltaproteobacteria bacterium]|nr:bifunctional ADP-heptose synthase [Deltaproteobacteria bacterium]
MADARLLECIDRLAGVRVIVVGDLIADVFLYGQTKRVSREAPVMVLEYERERVVLGGAANAVANIRALGAVPVPVGVVGADVWGRAVVEKFHEMDIATDGVVEDASRETTSKLRVVGSSIHTTYQQMIRIDRGEHRDVGRAVEERLQQILDRYTRSTDVIIASDYSYGTLSTGVIARLNDAAARGARVMVDSRYRVSSFKSAHTLTPNEPEAQEATGLALVDDDEVRDAAKILRKTTTAANVLITRGRRGMALFAADGGEHFFPIFGGDEVADVTGAGDTVIATYACAIAAGIDPEPAARLANVAGGLVVMKHGTATVTAAEMRAALEREHAWDAS